MLKDQGLADRAFRGSNSSRAVFICHPKQDQTLENMLTNAVVEIALPVVRPPESGVQIPLIRKASRDPYFMGGGQEDLLCGCCQAVLAKAVCRKHLRHAILLCSSCGNYVELNGAEAANPAASK